LYFSTQTSRCQQKVTESTKKALDICANGTYNCHRINKGG
jgi:hypothetical protein